MARRRAPRTRTVYRRARTTYRRARTRAPSLFNIGGKFKPAIAGAICSIVPNFVSPYLGDAAHPVVNGAVGYLMNDKTAMFMAGYTAGGMIGSGGSITGGGVR